MTRRTLLQALSAAAVGNGDKPAKPELKRRTWTRYHHELLNSPLWRRVARISGAPLDRVEALIVRLEVHASNPASPGYVEDIDLAAIAAHWNLPTDEPVGRIYAALEEVGWIEQGQLATYWSRNPDGEQEEIERRRELDRQRQRNKRSRAKQAKAALRGKFASPQSRDHHVTGVTVTPRAEQSIKQTDGVTVDNSKDNVAAPPHGTSDEGSQAPERLASPELWLKIEGVRIVVERLAMQPLLAETNIERWKRELGGDAFALAEILQGAGAAGYRGDRFREEVVLAVVRAREHAGGQRRLALPVQVKGKTGHG